MPGQDGGSLHGGRIRTPVSILNLFPMHVVRGPLPHQPHKLVPLDGILRSLDFSRHIFQFHLAGGDAHQLFPEFLLFLLRLPGPSFRPGTPLQFYGIFHGIQQLSHIRRMHCAVHHIIRLLWKNAFWCGRYLPGQSPVLIILSAAGRRTLYGGAFFMRIMEYRAED